MALFEQLHSLYSPEVPDTVQYLRKIVELCRRRWIRDFLFSTNASHLTIMTGPGFKSNAVAVKVSEVTQSSASGTGEFTGGVSTLFLPAFTADDIAVGFGIAEIETREGRPSRKALPRKGFLRDRVYNFRTICDTRDGTYVIVKVTGSEVNLDCASLLSSTSRQRCRVTFSRNQLMKILTTLRPPTDEELAVAVSHITGMLEFRNCPTCQSLPNFCRCSLKWSTPQHPLDFSTIPKMMASQWGSFEAVAKFNSYVNGVKRSEKVCGVRTSIQGMTDPTSDLVNRLTYWSISEHLQPFQDHPMASLLAAEASADLEFTTSKHSEGNISLGENGELAAAKDHEHEGIEIAATGVSNAGTCQEAGVVSSLLFPSSNYEGKMSRMRSSEYEMDKRFHHRPVDSGAKPACASIATFGSGEPGLRENYAVNCSDHASGSRPDSGQADGSQRTSHDSPERKKEEALERRREKNREAARRSDVNRKMLRAAMNAELEELAVREHQLRRRETELRSQNIRLRQLIVSRSVN